MIATRYPALFSQLSKRLLAVLALPVFLAACTAPTPQDDLVDLGAFRMGHNVVVAPKVQMVPGSREVTAEEWETLLQSEMQARFSQYDGDQLYHFGLSVEGFFVAPGGVPLVLSPKSVLAVNVTVWDDAAGSKLNAEPETFTVFETTSGESFLLGSGNSRTREEQMLGLARNAVREIEQWMVERRETDGWFEAREGASSEAMRAPQSGSAPAGETAADAQ